MIQEANLTWRYIDTETNLLFPWYTYPCLQWLKEQDVSNWIVFEYGCGYSTIWWRANCLRVLSVDSSRTWAKAMGATNEIIGRNYIHAIDFWATQMGKTINPEMHFDNDENNLFDCIVIDGDNRIECLKNSWQFLKSKGVIIIDNYGQEDFPQDACDITEGFLKGWMKQSFKQPNHTFWTTAVFQKP